MKKQTSKKIEEEFEGCVLNTIARNKKNEKGMKKPFHEKLLSEDILRASVLERSFSTSFGQRAIESISKIVALGVKGTSDSCCTKKTSIVIDQKEVNAINEHLSLLRENKLNRKPCWELDLKSIKNSRGKTKVEHEVISDLWFLRDGVNYFFSIKTSKPNIDQTEKAKSDMLKLKVI